MEIVRETHIEIGATGECVREIWQMILLSSLQSHVHPLSHTLVSILKDARVFIKARLRPLEAPATLVACLSRVLQ
jgi:hypothetical protein